MSVSLFGIFKREWRVDAIKLISETFLEMMVNGNQKSKHLVANIT
jgi:hypothetical protein